MTAQDKHLSKLLVAGYVTGLIAKDIGERDDGRPIFQSVRPVYDEDGLALPRFEVDMPSGTYTLCVIDNGQIVQEDEEF